MTTVTYTFTKPALKALLSNASKDTHREHIATIALALDGSAVAATDGSALVLRLEHPDDDPRRSREWRGLPRETAETALKAIPAKGCALVRVTREGADDATATVEIYGAGIDPGDLADAPAAETAPLAVVTLPAVTLRDGILPISQVIPGRDRTPGGPWGFSLPLLARVASSLAPGAPGFAGDVKGGARVYLGGPREPALVEIAAGQPGAVDDHRWSGVVMPFKLK